MADSPTDNNFPVAADLLRKANQRQLALETLVRTNSSVAANTALVNQINDSRNRLTGILRAYQIAYGTTFGNPPDVTGMQGLGQWQIYVAGGVAIGVIVAALYEWHRHTDGVEATAQAAAAQQANIAYAQQQLAQAQAAGDATAAAQWAKVLQSNQAGPIGGPSISDWFAKNWGWVAAGVGAFLIVKEVA